MRLELSLMLNAYSGGVSHFHMLNHFHVCEHEGWEVLGRRLNPFWCSVPLLYLG